MKHPVVVVALMGLAACGGGNSSPTSPTPSAVIPPPSGRTLAPGRYDVVLLAAQSSADPRQPDCSAPNPGNVLPIPPMVVRVRGTALADGDRGLVLHPDAEFDRGFEWRLSLTDTGLRGTVLGSVHDLVYGQVITVDNGQADTAATVTGMPPVLTTIIGQMSGRSVFADTGAGAGASCRLNRWMMIPE